MPTKNSTINTPGKYTTISEYFSPPSKSTSYGYNNAAALVISKTWVRTPNFAKLKKLHLLPENPFSYSRQYTKNYSGTLGYYTATRTSRTFGSLVNYIYSTLPLYTVSSSEISAQDGQAITKLRLQIKDMKVNFAQAYAERSQTIGLIADAATKIASAMTHLRRGDIISAAKNLSGLAKPSRKTRRKFKKDYAVDPDKASADAWLALQYGWKPLLSDVYGLAEFAAQHHLHEVRTSAKVQSSKQYNATVPFVSGQGYGGTYVQTVHRTVKYGVRFALSSSLGKNLSQMGISNPGLLIWELLPYSFVVDWFLPIGNYLSSLDATLGVQFTGGYKVTFQRSTCVGIIDRDTNSVPVGTTKTASAVGSISLVSLDRSALSGFPLPQLPSFKDPTSVTHLANAIGLIVTAFHRR